MADVVKIEGHFALFETFKDIFFRPCVVDARIYDMVDAATLQQHREMWAKLQGIDLALMPETAGPFCSPTLSSRLDKWRLTKKDDTPIYIVNLSQHCDAHPSSPKQSLAPRVLAGSMLYDVVADKELIALQHFLIQGFPVPKLVAAEHAQFFPFPDIIDVLQDNGLSDSESTERVCHTDLLSDQQTRRLAGKSFHWACMGSVLMYAWSCSTVSS